MNKPSSRSLDLEKLLDQPSVSTSPSQPAKKSKRLLNHYLSSPTSIDQQISQLEKKSTSPIKQLGSLEQLLAKGQPISDSISSSYTTDQFKTTPPEKKIVSDPSAFSSSSSQTHYNPYKNLSLIIFGIFGIGASIFGIDQFIKNANINFASENSPQVAARPPKILAFQGRLSDIDQNSVNELKTMRFELYNTSGGNAPPPIGGEKLWDSGFCQVLPNQNGIFSVNLGAGQGNGQDDFNCGPDLGNIFAENTNLWLQITVEDEVLFPRQLIKSVPFALNSATLQGFSASQSATANTIPVVDNQGNLNFATDNTAIVNFGQLGLVSQTGDLYLLPGAGTVYVGDKNHSANIFVTGDATISGNLNLDTSKDQGVLFGSGDLQFRSQLGQNLWQTQMTLTNNGSLGLGTIAPTQKLTINQGSLGFNLSEGPAIDNLQLSENAIDPQGLARIAAPKPLVAQTISDQAGNLPKGTYQYAVSFITNDGAQTSLSQPTIYKTELDSKQVLISNLDTYPLDNVVARKVYRTKKDDSTFYLLKTISDNLTTSFIDNRDDSQLTELAPNFNQTGTYQYKVTFVTPEGETNPSAASTPLILSGDGRIIKISNLPLAPTDLHLLSRKVYRSLANSANYHLVATISDNSTLFIYDNLSDQALSQRPALNNSGGIYANNKLALQFNANGSITTSGDLVANGRLETTHGDNQGLRLPTSLGKPLVKVGQKTGDVVYDSVGKTLYIYNGQDFVATGLNNNSVASNIANSSNCTGNLCRLVLDPEYPGAIITGDGSDNDGFFGSGHETINDRYYFNYYDWSSPETTTLNDFDTIVNLTLPSNFSAWQNTALTMDFATQSLDSTQNSIDLEIFRSGTQLSFAKTNQVSSQPNQWMSRALGTSSLIITQEELNTLGFSAGDTLTLKIKTKSKNNNLVKIGQINLNYLGEGGVIDQNGQSVWKQLAGTIFPANTSQDVIFGGDSTASAKIALLNLGNLGTPTLYVKGNIFLDSQTKNNYLDLSQGSSFNIRTMNENKTATERFTILPNGNIGIGTTNPTEKLEVAGNVNIDGSLKLSPMSASDAGACNLNSEGRIYYDRDQLKFFACQALNQNRTDFSWTPLSQ